MLKKLWVQHGLLLKTQGTEVSVDCKRLQVYQTNQMSKTSLKKRKYGLAKDCYINKRDKNLHENA